MDNFIVHLFNKTRSFFSRPYEPEEVYRSDYGETFLHHSASMGKIGDVILCIEDGENIDKQDYFGNTPLHEACFYGQFDVVEYLLKKGANPNILNKKKLLPLDLAMQKGHDDIILLFEKRRLKSAQE